MGVEDIPNTGLHIEIEAPPVVRAALAELAGLRNLRELSAVFDLTRQGDEVHVSGQVNARVGQNCVVTLEPLESTLAETVDLKFAPFEATVESPRTHRRGNDEPLEPLVGGSLDLAAVATEFLMLGIDPYPRKAGVEFALPQAEERGERPFAALETLKSRLGGGKS